MYLLIILIIVITIPFIVIPPHVKLGATPPYRVIVYSMLITTASTAMIFMAAAITGNGLYAQFVEITKEFAEETSKNAAIIEQFATAGISEDNITELIISVYDIALMRLPVTIMLFAAIMSYIAYKVSSAIMSRHVQVKKLPAFREFSFPYGTAMAVMLMYVVSWLMTTSDMQVAAMMYVNINMLFDLVFSIQGITVVLMFFHFKKAPKPIGVIVVIVMWLTSIGQTFLMLLGMADLIMGLKMRMGSSPKRY